MILKKSYSASRQIATVKKPVARLIPLLLLALLLEACAGVRATGPGSGEEHRERDYLMGIELRETGYTNVYSAILSARPNWLNMRGERSFLSPGSIKAYYDGTYLGSTDELRRLNMRGVSYIRYFDGIDASARWGLDHEHGVIYVSTRPPRGRY